MQTSEPQFQQPQFQPSLGTPPENYLVWAILSTIFCCMPFGIVSIVKSTQVNTKFIAGDILGAQKASEDAKKWAIIALIAQIIFIVLYLLIFGATIFSAVRNGSLKSY